MLVKQSSYYRVHDTEQNDVKVDKFLISCWSVRSDGKIFVIKEMRSLGKEEVGAWRTKGVYFDKVSNDF